MLDKVLNISLEHGDFVTAQKTMLMSSIELVEIY